jgi:hypothetical protein
MRDRNLRIGALASLTILGGSAGYWALKAITRSRRTRAEGPDTGKTELPSAESQMRAAELGKRWHSLDQDRAKGHVPRDLSRAPKDMNQRIHTEPTTEEASYLD